MSRSIFTDTERIMSPDKLDWHFHQCRQSDSGLHIVRKYEECSTCRNDSAMEIHTYTHASHSKLADACLKERTCEIVLAKIMCLLQEAIGLVGIRQIGRGTNHIGYLFGKNAQASRRCCTSSDVWLLDKNTPIYLRSIAREPSVLKLSLIWIFFCPLLFCLSTLGNDCSQFIGTIGIESFYFVENTVFS